MTSNFTEGELDMIEVRYEVLATFEVHGPNGGHTCADASFSVTSGVYSGVPDKKSMAGLIASRTVEPDDFDEIVGDLDADALSIIISTRGVKAEEIRSMIIAEVLFEEKSIATSIEGPHND